MHPASTCALPGAPAPSRLALARQEGADVKMTSEVVRKLEAKGLLQCEIDPEDTRARRMRITQQGVQVALRPSPRSSAPTRGLTAPPPVPTRTLAV
jgi:DNA-binding MarR family transcriptional regulator